VRKIILAVAAVATIALVIYEPAKKDGPASAPRQAAATTNTATAKAGDPLQVPERRGLEKARGELFGAPPPPQTAAKAGPSAPVVQTAPPMPYRFAGRVRKGGEEEVLLSKGDLIFAVKESDTIDGTYKVVAVKSDSIELLYLPLNTAERIIATSALDVDARAPMAAVIPSSASAPSSPAPVADSRPAQLRWDGPKQVQAGGNFTVALRVSTQEPLRAAPMQLRYAPNVLEPVDVKPGKFIANGSFSYRVNPGGSIFVGATAPSVAPGADAELVILTFKPLLAGATAELSMSALSLQGVAGRAIAHEQPASFRAAIQ
jgi:hypothetical protein